MGVQGTGFRSRAQQSKKTVVLFSPKRQTIRNPHSQPASHSQQTLIQQLKICTKEMKNPGVRIVPLFHGLKEKESCPQPSVTVMGSERQDLQTNRHRKEGTSSRTNSQVSIKEWKKTAVYPGFQAMNTLCCILDILISFRAAQGTELSISSFLTPLCDPCAPALHS